MPLLIFSPLSLVDGVCSWNYQLLLLIFQRFLIELCVMVSFINIWATAFLPFNVQSFVLAWTLLNINHLLWSTSNPIHSYAGDSTLHVNSHIPRPSSGLDLNNNLVLMYTSLSIDLELMNRKPMSYEMRSPSIFWNYIEHKLSRLKIVSVLKVRRNFEYCSHMSGAAPSSTFHLRCCLEESS